MLKAIVILSALPLLLTFVVKSSNGKNECLTSDLNKKIKTVQKGTWGGDHIHLEVGSRGARVEYDCAHGSMDQKLVLDAQGRFKVAGTHVRERGGPTRRGEEQGERVLFSGQLTGKTMSLKVTDVDTGESLGEFSLTYGRSPRLMKCK